jgi:acetyl-CoA carboxylase biotin carboxylase subunit
LNTSTAGIVQTKNGRAGFRSQKTREGLTAAALRLAKKVGYSGVGTVEFLVDAAQNFYFLEMNTRLQVEHPVTELITGLDLVQMQIEIGEGKPLSLKQEDVTIRGAAIECRIYAEDPENNFFPSPGTISWVTTPEGPGVRVDMGVYAGAVIPIYYDPMIAKLVVWGENREQAMRRMNRAIAEFKVGGVKNNIPFLKTLLENKDFIEGNFHTRYIDDHPELAKRKLGEAPPEWIFGLAAFDKAKISKVGVAGTSSAQETVSPWKTLGLRDSLNNRF